MRNKRLSRGLPRLVWLLALVSGCQSFYPYRPVVVLAQDAETKKPIPGAEVRIWYLCSGTVHPPSPSTGTASPDGVARLRAAPCAEAGIVLEANAPGYLQERKDLSDDSIKAIEPLHFFEKAEQRPVSLVVELFAGPGPSVELMVPDGYRGLVKADIKVQPDAPCPPGQRVFRFGVPPSGEVHVTGPALLERVCGVDFHARYVSGAALESKPGDEEIGFRSLKYEGGYYYFLIGTRSAFDAWRRSAAVGEATESKSSGGGKGTGRGRRNRGGDRSTAQPPSPSTSP